MVRRDILRQDHARGGRAARRHAVQFKCEHPQGQVRIQGIRGRSRHRAHMGQRVAQADPSSDDDLGGEMYTTMVEEVCAAGYEHYEISNFCLPGFESRHNTKYWAGAPYYGFGCSAHSYDGGRRRWANERDAAKYVEMICQNRSPIVERTSLSEHDARSESIFLGLRLMHGIDLQDHEVRFGEDMRSEYNGELDRLIEAGLIEIDGQSLRLTKRGALLSNEVFSALA